MKVVPYETPEVPPKSITLWPSNPIKIKITFIINIECFDNYDILYLNIPRITEKLSLLEGIFPKVDYNKISNLKV